MKRMLCLWLPHWPLQHWRVAHPERAGQALVLYTTDSRRGRRVVDCSAAARQQGVRPAMPLTEATALLRRSRQAGHAPPAPASAAASRASPSADEVTTTWHCQPQDPRAEREALAKLAEVCERFSPLVGWCTVGPQGEHRQEDGLYCEIGGVSPLFGGEQHLLRAAQRTVAARGYRVRIGVADTAGAAWALARFGHQGSERPWVCAAPGQTWERLRRLPVAALRLEPRSLDLFQQLGLLWVEQLAALPRAEASARLGALPFLRLDQALGTAAETLVAHRPPPANVASQWLESPTASRRVVETVVAQLLQPLAAALQSRQQGALQLDCQLDCLDRPPLLLRIALFRPTASLEHWCELARMQFEQTALPGAVHRISVAVIRTAPLTEHQGEMFAGLAPHVESRLLAGLVDRLSNRLGPDAVVRPRLTSDIQPELAYELEPLSGGDRRAGRHPRHSGGTNELLRPWQRPLLLYTPPRPVEVLAVVPDGPPIRCRAGNLCLEVAEWWGPERIETGWWRGPPVRRDYYRVQSRSGSRFWLFRRLADGQWFLQGEFT